MAPFVGRKGLNPLGNRDQLGDRIEGGDAGRQWREVEFAEGRVGRQDEGVPGPGVAKVDPVQLEEQR